MRTFINILEKITLGSLLLMGIGNGIIALFFFLSIFFDFGIK